MSLRGYIKKGEYAPWKKAFDALNPVAFKTIKRIPVISKRNKSIKSKYNTAAKRHITDLIDRHFPCPVMYLVHESELWRYSDSDRSEWDYSWMWNPTQIHHRFGRLNNLLLWEPGWVGVSRIGHLWIHDNIESARAIGLICEKGDWNKQPDEVVDAVEKLRKKMLAALIAKGFNAE